MTLDYVLRMVDGDGRARIANELINQILVEIHTSMFEWHRNT